MTASSSAIRRSVFRLPTGEGRRWLLIVAVIGAHLVLAAAMALTRKPWVDEAWFASPALNLLTRGVFATTNLETAGTWLVGLDQYTYWITPLHMLVQAGWYTVFGFGVLSLRGLSMVWGLVALLAVFAIVHRLTGRRGPALLAMALVATDYLFIRAAADGRMDMMSASLGLVATATYLLQRERSLRRAVLIGHACAAASLLTHPNGVLPAAALSVLILFLDRRRLGWREVALAATPYVAGLSAWGLYIAQAPHLFLVQFGGNAAGQPWEGIGSWFESIWQTYAAAYGLRTHWAGPVVHLRALILLVYLSAVAGVLMVGALRRRRDVRALLLLLGTYFLLMSLLRRESAHEYLVHIIPFYAAVLAVWLAWVWNHGGLPRRVAAAAAAGLILLQTGGVAMRVRADTYRRQYVPLVEFLRAHAGPGELIMGGAELGFALGFTARLVDDTRLGFHSGRHAELIVVDERYETWFTRILATEPDVRAHVHRVLAEQYGPVYSRPPYVVYRCRQHAAAVSVAAQAPIPGAASQGGQEPLLIDSTEATGVGSPSRQ
jgi:hypothetical protein